MIRFGPFEIDPERHVFRRAGKAIALEPQVFDLMLLFAENPGRLIGRDEMIDAVWGGRIVSEATISSRINAVRRALGDSGREQSVLKTVPRRGFQLLVESNEPKREATDAPAPTVRMTTSPDGTLIAYADNHAGPPLLRAGHFLTHLERDWSSPIWRPLLDRLGASHRVIRYDQRGTGLSDASPKALGLDAFVDDLISVADAAGADRFPVFAASQGVPVAVACAARYPDRVSRLVLYGGFATGRLVDASDSELKKADAMATLLREGWGQNGSAFAAAFSTVYIPDADAGMVEHLTEMQLASATPLNAVALRSAIDTIDVNGVLEKVRAPTLVVHMKEDAVQPVGQAAQLAAGIPGAQMRIIEGRNHIPIPGRRGWDEAMDAIERFLALDPALA